MKRNRTIIVAVTLVLLAGATFANRGALRESYARWQRGPIPAPVPRQQAQSGAEATNSAVGANVNAVAGNTNTAPATNVPVNAPKPPVKPPTNTNSAPVKPTGGVPASYNLSVLFFPQAPAKNWDAMHEDTCEEASMYMLQAYQNDVSSMSIEAMEAKLTAIIDYEKDTYGGDVWKSMPMSTAEKVMHDFLKLPTARVLPITSLDDVRAQIAAGHPVLLPAAGKQLHNPNFKDGGPLYHALVAKGYTKDTIITNDPGTRLGADYAYKNDVLWNAIHDWNGGDVLNGAKVMIVVE